MDRLYKFYKEYQVFHNFETYSREEFVKQIEQCSDETFDKLTQSLREYNFNITNKSIFNFNKQ
jgi:hypothetical protein